MSGLMEAPLGHESAAHPTQLFAHEVGVTRPTPQALSDEPALCVLRGPLNVYSSPFVFVDLSGGLVFVERLVLVVRGEFDRSRLLA